MNAPIHPTMLDAMKGFMPPAPKPNADNMPNKLVDPVEFKGMVKHEYTHTNLVLDCYLDYEKGFDGGTGPNSDESYPERMTLSYALANGVDVLCLLDEDAVSDIEAEALAAMTTHAFDDAMDRAADRYEERWAA